MSTTPNPTPGDTTTGKPLNFEDALADLDAIVARIETGDLELDALLADYETGVKLVKQCRSILDRADLKIRELSDELRASPAADDADTQDD